MNSASASVSHDIAQQVADIFHRDSRRVFATLVRRLGGFDLAEEALQEAFRAALERWPAQGMPTNPVAWLVSAGRFKTIDKLRRDQRWTLAQRLPSVLLVSSTATHSA